jgi:RNA polymerase sigma-70 factor (ECF subfamily)
MDPHDDELLKKARKGDQRAFRELVERYEGKVAATVVGMLGRGPEAEDVGQEVFVRLYRSLEKFRGDSSLSTYLTRIAINQSIKTLKRRQSWSQRFIPWDSSIESRVGGNEDLDVVDLSLLVNHALQQLNPDHRAVAVLRLMEGYSTRQTAALLNIPEGTVMSRLSRAVDKLEAILQPEMETS